MAGVIKKLTGYECISPEERPFPIIAGHNGIYVGIYHFFTDS